MEGKRDGAVGDKNRGMLMLILWLRLLYVPLTILVLVLVPVPLPVVSILRFTLRIDSGNSRCRCCDFVYPSRPLPSLLLAVEWLE